MTIEEFKGSGFVFHDGALLQFKLGFRLTERDKFSTGLGGMYYNAQTQVIHEKEIGYSLSLHLEYEHFWAPKGGFLGLYSGADLGFGDLHIVWDESGEKGNTIIQTFQPQVYMGYRFPIVKDKWHLGAQAGYSHLIELREVGQNVNLNGGFIAGLTLTRKI